MQAVPRHARIGRAVAAGLCALATLATAAERLSFAARQYPVRKHLWAVAVADVDGDLLPGLAATSYSSRSVMVLLNRGARP